MNDFRLIVRKYLDQGPIHAYLKLLYKLSRQSSFSVFVLF